MNAAISRDMHVAAPPWDYNPSSWRQRGGIAALAMVAFFISAYMAAYQWRLIDTVWDPIFGSQTNQVLDSDVSERMKGWFGIPDAALGAIAYLGDAIFGLAGCTRRWQYRPWLVVLFGIDVIPLGGVSAILVLVQTFVLGTYCFLCIVTAMISLILVWWAYDEVWSSLKYLWRVWKLTNNARIVWDGFVGRYHAEADKVALVRN
jgi:Vitamin K epoxide reductase family